MGARDAAERGGGRSVESDWSDRICPRPSTSAPSPSCPPAPRASSTWEELEIGVINCNGEFFAIEDRCSHDDGPLAEGEVDQDACTVECPRHGSLFDLRTGAPKTLPAYVPVETFGVLVEGDMIKLEVD